MKKIKEIIFVCVLIFCFLMPNICALALNPTNISTNESNFCISDEEFNVLEHVDIAESHNLTTLTSLITDKKLSMAKNGNTLIFDARTICNSSVTKCGFKYIKIQQYKNGQWVDYKKYEDLYSNSSSCIVKKSLSVTKGYKYRVTAQHYAKKNMFSTEKIVSTTASLNF